MKPRMYAEFDGETVLLFQPDGAGSIKIGGQGHILENIERRIIAVFGLCCWEWMGTDESGRHRFMRQLPDEVQAENCVKQLHERLQAAQLAE